MKIVFLDVDGVLNSGKFAELVKNMTGNSHSSLHYPFDPDCLNNLKKIIWETDAKLVLISTWRLREEHLNRLFEVFKIYGLLDSFIGSTQNLGDRNKEIKDFLKQNDVSNYIILDDGMVDNTLINNLIRTNRIDGLTQKLALEAISKLNGYKMKKDNINIEDGVVLAIRGGGIRSSVGIGVLKALEETGVLVRAVSGTSLGAIAASLLAAGYDANEILRLFKEYDYILTKGALWLLGRGSVVIEDNLNREIGYKKFKDLDMECFINASYNTEKNPKMFLFSQELTPDIDVAVAARASASLQYIYGYYRKEIDGIKYRFFDGGYTANPYIPDIGYPVVCASFLNRKITRSHGKWAATPGIAEEQADIVIKPYVHNMGVVGSPLEMQEAYDLGYKEAMKTLKKIIK